MADDNTALLLQVSADISRLEKQFNKAQGIVDKGSRAMERRASQASSNLEKFFGKPNAAKALDKVFDATRFKVLDSGVARVGLFGSALEALGPIGLGVAAGVGAAALAIGQLHKAMDFADEIGDTAAKLQVSTDTLQEYRYALHALGGETSDADAAIGSFQETLGKAEAGAQKALKWFKALGFTQEELRGFKSTDEALQAVIARIAKLPTEAQRAGAASALGLSAMIPAINAGVAKFEELREAAHRIGYVLDSDTIQKLGDAKDKMEDMSVVVKAQLASALVDLAPIILRVSESIADMAREIANVLDRIRELRAEVQKSFREHTPAQRDIERKILKLYPGGFGQGIIDFYGLEENAPTINSRAPPRPPRPRGSSPDLDLPGKDTSAADAKARDARRRRVEEEIYRSTVDLLNIHNNEKRAIEDRLVFTLDGLDLERQRRKIELDELEADYARSKGKEGISHAERLQLENTEEQVRSGKEFNAKEDAALALKDEQLKIERQAAGFARDLLDVQEQLATTQAERRRIQLQILESERAIARKALEEELSRDANLTPDQRKEQLGQFDAVTAAQRTGVEASTRGPLEDWLAKLPRSADELNEALQNVAVDGIQTLNDSLIELSENADNAGDLLRSLLRRFIEDLERYELQKLEGQAFGAGSGNGTIDFFKKGIGFVAGLFGGGGGTGNFAGSGVNPADVNFAGQYADGTDYSVGGRVLVGERGPEILNIPRGSQIIPNDILRGLSRGPSGASHQTFAPTLHIAVMAAAGMNAADARRTGAQIGAEAMAEMARSRKKGFS